MVVRDQGSWFSLPNGDWHMSGWMHVALPCGSEWQPISICPRCFAVVLADMKHPFGYGLDKHEQWHAATDHPIPKEDGDGVHQLR